MIDLGKEFERMARDFQLEDKDVLNSVRTGIRSMWSNLIFKIDFLNKQSILIDNTNPRSKKRFPKVRKYKCAMCGEYFGSTEIELDHVVSENTLTDYEHINDFFTNIILTSPDKLQVLCKDKKTKKDGVVRFGCHSIKTFSERYGVSLEEARADKTAKQIVDKKLDKQWLKDNNVEAATTQVARRKQIKELLLNQLSKEKETNVENI